MPRNDLLVQARERTESPSQPGLCLSRKELAELVNSYLTDAYGMETSVDDNYIGKLERGDIRWPKDTYREALRAVLGVPTDRALGFTNTMAKVVPLTDRDPARRRGPAELGSSSLGAAAAALWDSGEPSAVPRRIGVTEIQQIVTAAQVFANWDHTYGGGLAREAVLAQLRWSTDLLGAECPSSLRSRLHSAVGWLAHTCGFMAFDAYAHQDARCAFRLALACAQEAGDWHLRAKVLSSMARQAIWIGNPDEGLTFTEQALVRADRLTPTTRAMLNTAHARALAKMRRTRDALAAVGRADEAFAHAAPANDPGWMAYYDHAQHAGDTGHALFDLALHGMSPSEATKRLAHAATGHTDSYARSRAIAQTKLASLTMATGDPREAVFLGNEALDTVGTIRSRRAADDVRELARFAAQHPTVPEATELRRRIGTVVVAS